MRSLYFWKFEHKTKQNCPYCLDVPESVAHVLLECPQFLAARQLLHDSLVSSDEHTATLANLRSHQAVEVITGDFSRVRPAARPEVQAATAAFLHAINAVRPI